MNDLNLRRRTIMLKNIWIKRVLYLTRTNRTKIVIGSKLWFDDLPDRLDSSNLDSFCNSSRFRKFYLRSIYLSSKLTQNMWNVAVVVGTAIRVYYTVSWIPLALTTLTSFLTCSYSSHGLHVATVACIIYLTLFIDTVDTVGIMYVSLLRDVLVISVGLVNVSDQLVSHSDILWTGFTLSFLVVYCSSLLIYQTGYS